MRTDERHFNLPDPAPLGVRLPATPAPPASRSGAAFSQNRRSRLGVGRSSVAQAWSLVGKPIWWEPGPPKSRTSRTIALKRSPGSGCKFRSPPNFGPLPRRPSNGNGPEPRPRGFPTEATRRQILEMAMWDSQPKHKQAKRNIVQIPTWSVFCSGPNPADRASCRPWATPRSTSYNEPPPLRYPRRSQFRGSPAGAAENDDVGPDQR